MALDNLKLQIETTLRTTDKGFKLARRDAHPSRLVPLASGACGVAACRSIL